MDTWQHANMVTKRELNYRQREFAKQYARTGNATESYRLAGYKVGTPRTAEVNGHKLLSNTEVNKAVDQYRSELTKASKVDQAFVISGLREIATTGEHESNRVRAFELLGKHLRMFVDVSESTVHHDVQPLQEFTLAQLAELRAKALSADADTIDAEYRVLPESTD